MKSVSLSLSNKGHRKTFAKNKFFGRILSTLSPGPFSEGCILRGAGLSGGSRRSNLSLGGPDATAPLRDACLLF